MNKLAISALCATIFIAASNPSYAGIWSEMKDLGSEIKMSVTKDRSTAEEADAATSTASTTSDSTQTKSATIESTKDSVVDEALSADGFTESELLEIQQEKIVKKYVSAVLDIGSAQITLSEALGLKEQADLLREENKILESHNSVDVGALKRHAKVTRKTAQLLEKRMKKEDELSNEAKKLFVVGVIEYGESVETSKLYLDEVEPFLQRTREYFQKETEKKRAEGENQGWIKTGKSWLDTITPMLNKKFKAALYLSKNSTSFVSTHGGTVKMAMEFGKSQDMDMPALDFNFVLNVNELIGALREV